MTVTAGQVAVKLNLDKSAFEAGMKSAKKSVDILSVALNGIASIGAGAMLLKVGKDALKASSDFEQATVQFGVMLASTEKASKLVNELQNMANVTPFETQDLLDASKVLLNFGTNLEEILPDLQMLGDISGGNKEKMRSMTLAFSQMSSAGRLMGQDLLQMINAGFNPLQQISEKTGKSMAELKGEMEEGKISVEMVKQAFKDATSEGGRFYGMMDKQSETLEGRLSTMNDAYTLLIRSISDAALPAIKEQVIQVTELIEKTNENISAFKSWASVNQSTVFGLKNAAIAISALAVGIPITSKAVISLITAYKSLGVVTASTTAYQLAFANLLKGNATLALIQYRTAIQATIIQVRALTVAMLANPITWVTVVLGAGAAAWWKYQQAVHETENAIKDLNAAQDQNVDSTTDAIRTIKELQGVKKLDYDQTKRLDEAIQYLTDKYPNYINKLKQELALKGQISQATAEQIANELTLAKVKQLTEKKQKIDKKVKNSVKSYKQSQVIRAARFGTPIPTEDTGRLGASKSLQRDQDMVNKELEKVKKERQAIVNELTSLNVQASSYSPSTSTSTASTDKKKKKKTDKQLAAEAKAAAKEALEYKLALLDVERYQTERTDAEIYKFELEKANLKIAATKQGTSEYAQALAEKLQLERDYEKSLKDLQSSKIVDDLNFEKQELDNKMAFLELEYEKRKMSKSQLLQMEIDIINKKKSLEQQALKEQLQLVKGNAAEEVKIKRASQKTIEDLNIEASRKVNELWKYQHQELTNFTDDIANEWGSTVSNLLNGQMTFAEATNSLFNNILTSFGNMAGEMVTRWIKDNMYLITSTKAFTQAKLWCDGLLGISTKKRIAENTTLAASEITTAKSTAMAASATKGTMTTLSTALGAAVGPIMKLAGAMAVLAVSSATVALSMPVIAISTTVTALSAALAALSIGLLNATMGLTAATSLLFAPISILLAGEFATIALAAEMASTAVAKLAVALAAASAAAIPLVGWTLAPAAAVATAGAIEAGQDLVSKQLQFREKGGEVKKGQPYIVGEKRPELFIPDRNGRIEPNLNSLAGGGDGGVSSTVYNTPVTISVQANDAASFASKIDELTDRIHSNLEKKIKRRQLAPLGGKA